MTVANDRRVIRAQPTTRRRAGDTERDPLATLDTILVGFISLCATLILIVFVLLLEGAMISGA